METELIKIKMIKQAQGSIDGITVQNYREGIEYNLPESLAKVFIENKLALKINGTMNKLKDEKMAKEPENKMVKEIENKSIKNDSK